MFTIEASASPKFISTCDCLYEDIESLSERDETVNKEGMIAPKTNKKLICHFLKKFLKENFKKNTSSSPRLNFSYCLILSDKELNFYIYLKKYKKIKNVVQLIYIKNKILVTLIHIKKHRGE
jgi:hypothetical protein